MLRLDPDKLKKLLGHTLHYQGVSCRVIEVLSEEPALVLQDAQDRKVIQTTQYGDANCWAPQIFTVTILNPHRDGFNPELPELAALDLLA